MHRFAFHLALCFAIVGFSGFGRADDPGKPVTPSDDTSALDQLNGNSRDLNAPLIVGEVKGDPKKEQVLILYANEPTTNADGQKQLDQLCAWLDSSSHPQVRSKADNIRNDVIRFKAAVDEQIADIKTARAAMERESRPAVVIVTNALVHDQKMMIARKGDAFRTIDLEVPKIDDPVLALWPISSASTLQTVLKVIAEQFSPQDHEFVLVTTSHGTPEFALTNYLSIDVTQVDRETVVSRLEQWYMLIDQQAQQRGKSLTDAAGKPLKLQNGKSVQVWKQHLVASGQGELYFGLHDGTFTFLDCQDTPVTLAGGELLRWKQGRIHIGKSKQLVHVDGEPLRLETAWGVQNTPISLAGQSRKELRQKLKTGTLRVRFSNRPAREQGIDKDNHLDKTDFLDKDDFLDKENFLGKEQMLGVPVTGTLSPEGNNTISPEGNNTISPEGNNTISPESNNRFAGKGTIVSIVRSDRSGKLLTPVRGVRKSEYVQILQQSGMAFPLLFVEACKSEFGTGETSLLKARPQNLGVVWTSDLHGLRYKTIGYNDVFTRIAKGDRISQAMMSVLTSAHREQRRQRMNRNGVENELRGNAPKTKTGTPEAAE